MSSLRKPHHAKEGPAQSASPNKAKNLVTQEMDLKQLKVTVQSSVSRLSFRLFALASLNRSQRPSKLNLDI